MDQADKPTVPHDLHLARSRLLDSFSDLETVVRELARSTSACSDGASLAQRVEVLLQLEPSGTLSQERRDRIRTLLKNAQQLLSLRAAMVHSKLRTVTVDGQLVACFINSKADRTQPYWAVHADLKQIRHLCKTVNELAKALREV
jgi:hypothetical protein